MLCPKCGQEYTGDSCPRCEGPKIIVNNKEYLERKMEYERKQAEAKSASSSRPRGQKESSDAEGKPEFADDDVRPDEVFLKLADRIKKKNAVDDSEDDEVKKAVHRKRRNRHIKHLVLALVLIIIVAAGVELAVRIISKNSQNLYTSYNGKIYNVSGIDSEYVCDANKAYFQADGKNFYIPDEPEDISGKTVVDKLASDGGKYFTSVIYDEDDKIYTLYLWNTDVCYALSSDSSSKSVVYISDDGDVVYKEIQMINDVGGMGETGLYLSQPDSTGSQTIPVTTQLSDSVRQFCVYTDKQLVIYNTSDDELCSFGYGKHKSETVIDTDVSAMYALKEDMKGYYAYSSSELNTDKNVSSIVYISDGKAYLYDTSSDEDAALIDSAASGVNTYIVSSGNGVYAISSSVVRYAEYKNKQLGSYESLISLGSMVNVIWLPDRESIFCVSSDGALKSINKGVVRDVADSVTDGSLACVNNADTCIVYVRDRVLYYINVVTFSEMIVSETADTVSTSDILVYQNRLYYYNSAGKLCSCTTKGSDNKLIGDVERFWLGR